jgi:dTDP-4-dehydrorhamnose 3,5-epimerase-like enzyme
MQRQQRPLAVVEGDVVDVVEDARVGSSRSSVLT